MIHSVGGCIFAANEASYLENSEASPMIVDSSTLGIGSTTHPKAFYVGTITINTIENFRFFITAVRLTFFERLLTNLNI